MNRIEVIKASGEKTIFKKDKLILSLKKAGASEEIATNIANDIEKTLFNGISTEEIYKNAFSKLKKLSRPTAARFKLKKAIMELGETGYPFEKFVAALLKSEGYKTQVGTIVKGNCVTHEVDVIAQNDKHHYMCECKFHNRKGRKCNVRIPLYIQSRFKDVEHTWLKKHTIKFHQGWIFTNTRFTTDAMEYGKCIGLKLISWDYPKNEGIKDRVDRTGIHPITCLTSLTSKEKRRLIELDIILCIDICHNPTLLNKIDISKNRFQRILEEASSICLL